MKHHCEGSLSRLLVAGLALAGLAPAAALAQTGEVDQLQAEVARLQAELARAEAELQSARRGQDSPPVASGEADIEAPAEAAEATSSRIEVGPFTIGGAIRANYVLGDYPSGEGPTRGSNGGNFLLDTFRINVGLAHEQWLGEVEYRWYDGYNFLHTGWIGYDFEEAGVLQVGVNRVPFGPGPYGVSNSWFFDQHYYVGLSDDMDLGVKYSRNIGGNLDIDLAYYWSDEGNWRGATRDSARYSYDPVVDEAGNGYEERHTFVGRAIYRLPDAPVPTDLGISAQYGTLEAKGAFDEDGEHHAFSFHMVNQIRGFTLKTQLTSYKFNVDQYSAEYDPSSPWDADDLIVMGAYDFAWATAAKAVIPAVAVSYTYTPERIHWLDSVTPYVEYSSIIKAEDSFNDSELFIIGAAWARGGWYVYTDLAFSNGNYFIGTDGDTYAADYTGTGDFGINGNGDWKSRFNINFGYYF